MVVSVAAAFMIGELMSVVFILTILLIPATAGCLYYFVLTTIGWSFQRRKHIAAVETSERLVIAALIPAHNEENGLRRTIESLRSSDYPQDKLQIFVVADNCSDDTAGVARTCGATVFERTNDEARGKGFALAFGIPQVLSLQVDVVLVVDADCIFERTALARLESTLKQGAQVAQASVLSRSAKVEPTTIVPLVGGTIGNGVYSGLDRLGLSVQLRGTGMAFRREVLQSHPWTSYSVTEDAEFGAVLRRDGIRVRFVEDASIFCEPPPAGEALYTQRRRWRESLFQGGLTHRLTASKPLVLLQLMLTSLLVIGAIAAGLPPEGWDLTLAIWTSVLLLLTAIVYIRAIRRSGLTLANLGTLILAIGVMTRLGLVTAGGFLRKNKIWERTPRVEDTPLR